MDDHDRHRHNIKLVILVDGRPVTVEATPETLVLEVIRRALGPDRAEQAGQFDLVPRGGSALDPSVTLERAGVRDGDHLSLNKQHGGGGHR